MPAASLMETHFLWLIVGIVPGNLTDVATMVSSAMTSLERTRPRPAPGDIEIRA